ncbi:M23 family metallopeptidase [Capnocytophaga canimorsus]|uniref:Peptidase n=1 Tax=Capnocytophaga canimorsus (strain 5) TaxID=860228 RepID=F9YR69_CAPCC|nr:M23 family metallopeptidase [Capnocytophaga canimorsus]AEK22427.1 Putative peptidase [Capnocytophaga canimorsus Cc5]CEN48949.1 putative peptidase [Capnocytophaga canimorsus]VEJ19815.1 Glycyl-glycine endopeptidase ALE-1 precursor [Capnocytophaga canimorsus]
MKKVKYYYDPETLSYKRIKSRKRTKVRNIGLFLLSSLVFGAVVMFLMVNTRFFYTPRELTLQREVKQYETYFQILNKKMKQMEEVLANIQDRDNNIYRLYFEAAPIADEQGKSGFGGVNRYEHLEKYNNSDLLINTTKRLEILQKQLVVQSKSLDEITYLAREKEKLLAAIPAIQPIQNKDLTRMASGYGWRTDPFTKARKFHYGMDFTAPQGTPIYAAGDGVITRADGNAAGYGEHIRIDHGYGYVSLYAHLSKYNVRVGQKVKRGDIIGFVGNTGRSQAPHLHYEVLKDGEHINPVHFYYGSLTTEEYAEMLRISAQENQTLD